MFLHARGVWGARSVARARALEEKVVVVVVVELSMVE
jgi:hypothetical protein